MRKEDFVMEKMFASSIIGESLSKATTLSPSTCSPEKSIIFIADNCGDQFKVKLYLTEEVTRLLDFLADVNIIDFWTLAEEDVYEI